ncbi:hypothetical protein [Streptomyces sp. NBC_00439]|uniref:hypothetical protein n=1 Tax=Streptomyces sp. NBC_00439 TaxID=2903650 RepID=UPI0022560CC6|nr:hypothetical protein [Streptomyces sp. NBC_00439]MCX5103680.1 hypothetical protein [Streptomyces sp. NBC_00439]
MERGRAGYALWQRAWASFTGVILPPRPVHHPAHAPQQAPAHQPQTRPVAPGWFALPPLPTARGLTASGSDAVVLEAASPDDRAAFVLRHPAGDAPEYSLELVVRGGDEEDRPLLATVTYAEPDGHKHVLLVPVVPGRFGPAASYVRLCGFGPGTMWAATGPSPVPEEADWNPATVVDSVGAALNETTRDAWRRVREFVSEEVGDVIDGALR